MKEPLGPDILEKIRNLWENHLELSAAQIGERFGITKNAVIGHAHRRGWERRRKDPPRPPAYKPPVVEHKQCRWPMGDPGHLDFHFCGREQLPHLPYCEEHYFRSVILKKPPAVLELERSAALEQVS